MSVSLDFYSDSGLTTAPASLAVTHAATGAGDPQDFHLYLGSPESGRRFRAASNPGVDSIAVSIVNTTVAWSAAASKSVNDRVRTSARNGYRYKATVGGTTGSSEPTWPTTLGNTVVDNTVTWTCEQKIHEATEAKLATTQGGLTAATPGAALTLSTQILSGSANAADVWLRLDDATATVGTETELTLTTNSVVEDVP
jgi:hypothetical protein